MFSVWRECTILQLTQVRQTWFLVKSDDGDDDDDDDDDDELGYNIHSLICKVNNRIAGGGIIIKPRVSFVIILT